MSDHKPHSPRNEGKASSKDIHPLIKGWDYEPGTINVRKVTGIDGRPKLQMRLDLGVLQMEMTGRPDGRMPHGCESLLEHHEQQLRSYGQQNGNDLGFFLTPEHCRALREEAAMYYHRYLSLFVLEDFAGVARDTERNLRVMNLCAKFGEQEHDRTILEQYRPYIIMMNARAKASIALQHKKLREALVIVSGAMCDIREFFHRHNRRGLLRLSNEMRILHQLAMKICQKLPHDSVERLKNKLKKALKAERYEEAARLRDMILARSRERKNAATPPSES
ncbi:MAG: UvrB/UvrC motif-containing protein [Phycisphaerales bacterium]|nr:UvrB/UvrC motif-containing protein [Phycisphaerales bacterium]